MSDTTKTPSTRADVCLRAAADALDNAELPYYESSQQRMGGLIELMDRAAELLRAAAEQAPESPSRNCAYCGCEARGVEPREQPVAEVQGDGFEISWLNRSPMPKGTKLYAPTTAEVDALRAENAEWKNWGTIEIAIRNAAVAESMRHWEGRNEKLTAENAALRSSLAVAREGLESARRIKRLYYNATLCGGGTPSEPAPGCATQETTN